jgi:RNA methyltransferase, TrmH family
MTQITSPANDRIKFIRRLRERKAREETGLFFIEGLRIVAEAVQQGAPIQTLVAAPDLLKSAYARELVIKCQSEGIEVIEVNSQVFERLSLKEGPQGLAAVVRQTFAKLEEVNFLVSDQPASRTWVALDSVADPGNLGTILRTHDGVGGEGVILLDQSTDPYDPSSARASMGALFSQRLVKTDFSTFARWIKQAKIPLIGTSGAAHQDYASVRYPDPCILLMGSERQGLQESQLALCDEIVAIPMVGASDSLNLSVATAVVLYEIFNQRREKI